MKKFISFGFWNRSDKTNNLLFLVLGGFLWLMLIVMVGFIVGGTLHNIKK